MEGKTIEDLRRVNVLNDLPDEHLKWLAERVECFEYEDGELIVRKNDPAEYMWFTPEGRFDLYLDVNGQQVLYYKHMNDESTGGVGGLLPYSRMKLNAGNLYAVGKSKRYTLHKKYFQELEQLNPALIQRLISYMTERSKSIATVQLQHEKISALGKLAAGIAHEMNNPASAINRISDELSKRVNENFILTEKLLQHKINYEHIHQLRVMVEEKGKSEKRKLTSIQKMQREDDINEWFEKCGLLNNNIAPETFADAGITSEDLDNIYIGFNNDSFPDVLKWLESLLISQKIIKDLGESSNRISNLVSAVKSHVHMDQSYDLEPTDIKKGIENTLTLLGYKLKEKNIKVNKIFAENAPEIPAYAGELNQVWSNIIDNAVYAMPKNGELTIETSYDGKNYFVKIADNGSGIPEDIKSRIFDPFFTTKKVGEGTGIGLDLVNRIVKHHNGEINVYSVPGRTEFKVSIPY